MGNKKKTKASTSTQSAFSYISSGRARSLPLGDCLINAEWKQAGLANIFISRKHVTGNITYAIFLVDVFWKGVTDTDVHFNQPEDAIRRLFDSGIEYVPIDYNLAHNIIYGAEAFAADYDIKPHQDFELARMILEEDDDRIPIINVEFGKDGKPFRIMDDRRYGTGAPGSNEDDDNYEDDDYESAHDASQEENDEAWPKNKSKSGNSDWQQEPRDGDLTPMLSRWTKSEWEKFFSNPKIPGQGDSFIDEVLLYVFDGCYIDFSPEPYLDWSAVIEKFRSEDFTITSKPVQTDDYVQSPEEQKLIVECYQLFERGDKREFTKQYKEKLKQVLAGIERWPNNKQLYNALQNLYLAAGEEQNLEEVLERSVKRFPGYLFGMVTYANHKLRKGKPEMVPAIMNKAYTITDVYPARSRFHVSEIFSFNQIWFDYFMSTNQLKKARHYKIQLVENVPPQISGMKTLSVKFQHCDDVCIAAIKVYLQQASTDPAYRRLMIDTLLKYSEIYNIRK